MKHEEPDHNGSTHIQCTLTLMRGRFLPVPVERPGDNMRVVRFASTQAENELPHPQVRTAFGFSKVKPCFSSDSYQSTVVPSKYRL